jgi:hypothetical protein
VSFATEGEQIPLLDKSPRVIAMDEFPPEDISSYEQPSFQQVVWKDCCGTRRNCIQSGVVASAVMATASVVVCVLCGACGH